MFKFIIDLIDIFCLNLFHCIFYVFFKSFSLCDMFIYAYMFGLSSVMLFFFFFFVMLFYVKKFQVSYYGVFLKI